MVRLRALPTVSVKPTHGAPPSLKRHCRSTCSAELRAPVSILARRRGISSSGNATHSRQPSSIIGPPAGAWSLVSRQRRRTCRRRMGLERAKGIEPSSVAWEATALPLSYARGAAQSIPRSGEEAIDPKGPDKASALPGLGALEATADGG